MGYDLRMIQEPAAGEAGYVPQDEDDPGYFRFHITAMNRMLKTMLAAGIIDDQIQPPALEPWPPGGITPERGDELEEYAFGLDDGTVTPTGDESVIIDRWCTQEREKLSTRSPQAGKAPAFKFCSNDGWIVTPEECSLIADGLRSLVQRVVSAGNGGGARSMLATSREKSAGRFWRDAVTALGRFFRRPTAATAPGVSSQLERWIDGVAGLGVEYPAMDMTPDEERDWILGFASYNEVAASHGGYEVH